MPSRYASLIITRKSEFIAKKLHIQYFLFKTNGHQRQYDDKFEYTFILTLFYYIFAMNKFVVVCIVGYKIIDVLIQYQYS